jgi:hypothetical protein
VNGRPDEPTWRRAEPVRLVDSMTGKDEAFSPPLRPDFHAVDRFGWLEFGN